MEREEAEMIYPTQQYHDQSEMVSFVVLLATSSLSMNIYFSMQF